MSWADAEFADVRFGDQRLNRRLAHLAERLADKPSVSIPAACRGWAETQAAYRFFDQREVTAEAVLAPHAQCTLERARVHPVVLAIQDTTELDFGKKTDIVGLGPLSYARQRGLYAHPTFLVTPERVPLGVFDAWLWARDPETFGQSTRHLPIEAKESVRWLEGFQRLSEVAHELPQTQLVYVADREADIYELLVTAQDSPVKLLVRAQHDRALFQDRATSEADPQNLKLRQQLQQQAALGDICFEIPKTANRPKRTVTQTLHAQTLRLKAPRGKARRAKHITITALLAQEIQAPEGETPVSWLLLTTLPVDTFEQACDCMAWYLCRWEVELLFKVLKSGCKVEELQLQHIDRLEPAIALFLIIAWRILLLTKTARACPQLPCDVLFETEEWQAVYIVTHKTLPPDEPPPLDTIVRMLAAFGGFLNRKHDGFPGSKSIWIGLQRVQDFAAGIAAQKAADP